MRHRWMTFIRKLAAAAWHLLRLRAVSRMLDAPPPRMDLGRAADVILGWQHYALRA